MRLAVLHSTVRAEEKLILQAAAARGIETILVDIRNLNLDPAVYQPDFDLALERSVSTIKGNYITHFLERQGIPVVNSSQVARVCEDKYLTSLSLERAQILTPRFTMVFSLEQALSAVEELGGFPVVLKPPLGSWGRLLAKINDTDALEAIFEHKDVLGSPQQKAIYIQQFVRKPGRDIRAFVLGGETICAIYRDSEHWITNTARGAKAKNCPVTKDISIICRKASEAVGGGILALDLFETDHGLQVNEINHTMEFKNSEEPTGISISGAIVDYCVLTPKERLATCTT